MSFKNVLYLFCMLFCFRLNFSKSAVLTGSIEVCEELDKPTGWTIKDLREVNLYAWPWECLNSRYSNESLREAITDLSPDVEDAAKHNYKGFVQYIIESENWDAAKIDEFHLLHMAAYRGYLDLVKYFSSEKHAAIELLDPRTDLTPLQYAVDAGHLNVIRFLIEKKKANVNVRTSDDENLLHTALFEDKVEVMKYLMDEQKMFDQLDHEEKFFHHNVLHQACFYGAKHILRFLIDDRNLSITQMTSTGRSLLHSAIDGGYLDIVKYLVEEKDMDPQLVKSTDGMTAFDYVKLIAESKKYFGAHKIIFEYFQNRLKNQS